MLSIQIVNQSGDTQVILADRVIECKTFLSKKLGLLNHSSLPIGHGVLLVGAKSIHTKNMHTEIDVIFLDENQRVLATHPELKPGTKKLRGPRGTKFVLELGPKTLGNDSSLKVGSKLLWSEVSHAR